MAVLVDLNGTSIQECSEALFLSTALEDLTDTTPRATATASHLRSHHLGSVPAHRRHAPH